MNLNRGRKGKYEIANAMQADTMHLNKKRKGLGNWERFITRRQC
jgi:hypothetical protein